MEHPDLWGFRDWRPLARGAHAVVWEARQLSLNRLVAVKVLPPEISEDSGFAARFMREARALARDVQEAFELVGQPFQADNVQASSGWKA